jgi:hypothetical protein
MGGSQVYQQLNKKAIAIEFNKVECIRHNYVNHKINNINNPTF